MCLRTGQSIDLEVVQDRVRSPWTVREVYTAEPRDEDFKYAHNKHVRDARDRNLRENQ